ncbi:DUF4822 domain-containing protein [Tsukamurella ocularis]|uniref:DUF4822 domain-containing protein n=1 Tax=Tsukamurella ocularis TaxID=1970234 RepID=UPI00216A85F3|nr:DUF4822 domain-containing protein [Tsukamurella ocularis]MCS3780233.1 type IV secretory pathway TrbL component [Tsukamurella ocularis]MCS3786213.1 type IV secretory pathway TrbL component [Tsukamurella ocularis]MCS3849577.1 type IV secretory pathway TrbL component [Tsukamurella ocularis]
MHKSIKLVSVTFAAAAVVATSACAAGSYAAPGSPSSSAKASASAKPSAKPSTSASASASAKPSASKLTPVKAGTPSAILASTAWETTSAKDAKGDKVALTDKNVKNYVGWAYFKKDGTFTLYNLDDSAKGKGDWTVSADGKTRTIVAKNADGSVQYKRTVEIVTLTEKEFTYRVYPEASTKAVYYDIVHTATKHAEPRA